MSLGGNEAPGTQYNIQQSQRYDKSPVFFFYYLCIDEWHMTSVTKQTSVNKVKFKKKKDTFTSLCIYLYC